MNKKTKFIIFYSILFLLMVPLVSFAQTDPSSTGLVPCVGADCDFNALMSLVNRIIEFVLFSMALPISAIMFAYAGFLMVSSGGSSESKTKAKSIFTSTVVGLVIAVAAWLIISTILSILGYNGAWIGF